MNELNEKDLQLIVSEKELGTLKTNAINILTKVKEILPNYDAKYYDEENIEKAKEDKALLNNSSKALNKQRIELEKQFMQPFDEFKKIIKETTDLINEASSKIDVIVKEVENKAKDKKKNDIIQIFNKYVAELGNVLTFDKIFNEKWLNKTYRIELIENEIQERINTIRNDLLAISNLNSNYEVELKNDYLNNFNLSVVINKNNELIQKETLLKNQKSESEKIIQEQKDEIMEKMATTKIEEKIVDQVLTYTLKITGKTSQMRALKKFMEVNELKYEKIC